MTATTTADELRWRHTPGPWQLDPEIWSIDDGSETPRQVACVSPRMQREANGHLIAAAPELLAGLKDAMDYIRTYCGRAHGIDLKKWESVIAKAEGRP